MNGKLLKLLFSLALILSPLCVADVFACQCYGPPPLRESFENAKAIFAGKVLSLEIKDTQRIYTFQIKENFKGNLTKEVKVINGGIGDMCDYGFSIGESYLVYTFNYTENESVFYTSNYCTRNDSLSTAQGQIFFLRELIKGVPESQVYGAVIRNDLNQKTRESIGTPLSDIKILIEGEDNRFETATDKDGVFRFNKLPKGKYKVTLQHPDIYVNSSFPEEENFVVLDSGKVVSAGYLDINAASETREVSNGVFADFTLRWNNRVSVKVIDLEGKAVNSAKVRLLPTAIPFEKIGRNNYYDYNQNGEYNFGGLTPATYYLAIEIDAPFPKKNRLFYPQAQTPEKAEILNIKAIDNLKLEIIAPIVQRKIAGKILWSDEKPIAGDVRIVLSDTENADPDHLRWNNYDVASLDGASNFSLDAYAGAEYWIHTFVFAEMNVGGEVKRTKIETKPIKIKVEKINEPLKILIPKTDKSLPTN